MKAKLQTLTPIHVGNGTVYNKGMDFVQIKDQLGIVDEMKVLDLIGRENISQWMQVIEKYDPLRDINRQPLLDLFAGRGISIDSVSDISSRKLKLKAVNNHSSQLKEHYRTAIKGACIPGSSLKGALRTAIWDDLTSFDDFQFDPKSIKYEKQFAGKIKVKWKDEKVEKRLFGENANEKSTRFLKIGDIHFEGSLTEAHEVKILNIQGNSWRFKEGQHFLVEAIPVGQEAIFQVNLDKQLMDRNKEKHPDKWESPKLDYLEDGLEGLCSLVNNYTKSLLEWELETFSDEDLPDEGVLMVERYEDLLSEIARLSDSEFIIRVGGNNGWIFTTGGWWRRFTDEFNEEDLMQLRKEIQKKSYTNMALWPKTRKISSSGQIFGFVKVSFENA